MEKIAHISDLHFGAQSPIAAEALAEALRQLNPDLVIVTGDLTQSGRRIEFQMASKFLAAITAPVFAVPGNHDVPVRNLWARFVEPYARFERYVGDETDPVFKSKRLVLVGLNSARRAAPELNWSYGRLSQEQIATAVQQFKEAPGQTLKAIALHHPLKLGPGAAGSRIVGRGREALAELSSAGLDVAFTGHVHHSNASLLSADERSVILVEAGTATSIRTRGEPPAFNVVRADANTVCVDVMRFAGSRFKKDGSAKFTSDGLSGWAQI